MRKVYMKVEVDLIVHTNLDGVDEIMDSLEVSATALDELVDVEDCEVSKFYVTDSK